MPRSPASGPFVTVDGRHHGLKRRQQTRAVEPVDQPAVADDISGQNSGKATSSAFLGHLEAWLSDSAAQQIVPGAT
jgi:hypothetical protein